MSDPTFSDDALYGSTAWAATTLGMSVDTFYRRRKKLEREGFPKADPLTLRFLKADVYTWIDRRRTITDTKAPVKNGEPRYDRI